MTETPTDRFPGRAHSSSLSTNSRPWAYTARSDSEVALQRLVTMLRSGATRVAIEGAPGAGKTVLLHVLPERLGSSFASAYLPHPGLGPAGVRAWLENFAGPLPADAGSTFEDLTSAYARRGPGLVLLIDDANAMPETIAREFGSLLARTGDALRIVVAGVPTPSFEAVLAALGEPAPRVRIGASSGPSESLDAREGALARLARAPSESLAARQEPPVPSAPSIEPEPAPALAPARPRTPPPSSAVRPPPRPAETTDPPPTVAVEKRLQVTANSAGESERGGGRAAPSASAPALRPPPRPARAAWLRVAGIAGVVFAATASLALLVLRSDTRDGLPDVAVEASSPLVEAAPPPVEASSPLVEAPPPPVEASPPLAEAPPPPVEASPPLAEAPPPQPPAPVAAAPPVPVHVNARPWARIFVDGRELGVTPLGNVPIAPGLRRFRAELADGRVVERDVRVETADQKVTFR